MPSHYTEDAIDIYSQISKRACSSEIGSGKYAKRVSGLAGLAKTYWINLPMRRGGLSAHHDSSLKQAARQAPSEVVQADIMQTSSSTRDRDRTDALLGIDSVAAMSLGHDQGMPMAASSGRGNSMTILTLLS